jgi:hypothetical protein
VRPSVLIRAAAVAGRGMWVKRGRSHRRVRGCTSPPRERVRPRMIMGKRGTWMWCLVLLFCVYICAGVSLVPDL